MVVGKQNLSNTTKHDNLFYLYHYSQKTHSLGNLAPEDVALEQVRVVKGFDEAEAPGQVVFSLGAQYERVEGKLFDLVAAVAQRVQKPLE